MDKMVVDKKKFIEAYEYIRQINSTPLDKLDLSQFGEPKVVTHEGFRYMGLNNEDFITMNFIDNDPWTW